MSHEPELEIKSSLMRKRSRKRERRSVKWSWRPRISLRNWMLLMLATALWAAWYFKPQPVGQTMPGTFQLFYQEAQIKLAGKNVHTVVDGPLEIRDLEGRLVGRGQFDLGVAVGDWRYYYPNRGLRFGGPVRNGQRSGTWTATSRHRRKLAEIAHGNPLPIRFKKPADSEYADRTLPSAGAQRAGVVTRWQSDGHECLTGQFNQDLPSGTWIYADGAQQRPEQGAYVRGVTHGGWWLRDRQVHFVYGHRVVDSDSLVEHLIEEVKRDERRRWYRAIRALVTLDLPGNRGLLAALETNDRNKQLALLASLLPGRSLHEQIAGQVRNLASGEDRELACHAKLTLSLEQPVPTPASVRGVLMLLIDLDQEPESIVYRFGEHHTILVPCLRSLLADEDERVRRMSLDLMAGVITHGPFGYSWEVSGHSELKMIEDAVREATRSQDTALAAAAHVLIDEWFTPATGGFGNPMPALF